MTCTRTLALSLTLLAGCGPPLAPPPLTPTPPPSVGQTGIDPDALLAAHNTAREKRGLGPLTAAPALEKLAASHAAAMAARGVMSHDAAGDGGFSSRLAASGYTAAAAGENVAAGQATVTEVMSSWMNSLGHRANILGPYSQAGFAASRGRDGSLYWCGDFGRPWPLGVRAAGLPVIHLGNDPP